MTQILLIEIIGSIGVLSYVLSYALLQTGVIKGNGYIYPAMNLVGAGFVAISMLNNWNLWSFLISVSFAVFSVIGMTRVYLAHRKLQFAPREQHMHTTRFGMLTRGDMRKLLRAGAWVEMSAGHVLTTQGEAVAQLAYIAEGGVDVLVNDHKIVDVGPGEFIGELASLSSGAASATVILNQPSNCFIVPSERLRALVRGNADLRAELEFAFAGNIRSKLLATNERLQEVLAEHARERAEMADVAPVTPPPQAESAAQTQP